MRSQMPFHRHSPTTGVAGIMFTLSLLLTLLLGACTAYGMAVPIGNIEHRPTPLHFGMHVTPDAKTNPIQPPERFSGYHVGVDFEVSNDELDDDVPVYAVCGGTVLYSGFAEGYGGLLVHSCTVNGEDVTVMYGHLAVDTLVAKDTVVAPGDKIGILGAARSSDTDDNRKHLHLGIHKGTAVDVRGYVQTEADMSEFLDARSVLYRSPIVFGQPITPYWQEKN